MEPSSKRALTHMPSRGASMAAKDELDSLTVYVLATTDLHSNALNYDYFRDRALDEFGLAKIATLVQEIRAEGHPVFLFDNGDLIQGTPLAETQVLRFKSGDRTGQHPMTRIMNHLGYDAATVGNHEFNYGLEYLKWVLDGAAFSYVCSNILNVCESDGLQCYLPPYAVIERMVGERMFRLGVVGFVPPQIMQWDRVHLEGRVKALDIQVAAKMFIPQLKASGVDAVVALSHSGLVFGSPGVVNENSSFALTKVDPIDVIVAGHTHDVFPDLSFEAVRGLGVDVERGTISGKAVIMPGFWGSHLGVARLTFEWSSAKWELRSREGRVLSTRGVASDPQVARLVEAEHKATQQRMRSPVGRTHVRLHTYFARVADSVAVQLTNRAHIWYARRLIEATEFGHLPLLAVSPPFRAGFAGIRDYTDILPGDVARQHVADLYVYPNSFACVLVDGAQIRAWLERSAENFNQIDPESTRRQVLINDEFPTYNFDVFEGITYAFDVTRPAGDRVVELCHNGQPLNVNEQFVVVTNSYRANGGGRFPGLDGTSIVYEAAEVSAEVLVEYIRHVRVVDMSPDNNWCIKPFRTRGEVLFYSPACDPALVPDWLVCTGSEASNGLFEYRAEFPS
jgi:2',3'-cyclic-nucleotide 2'-phosphodiesterase/3'-nucleotidase